MKERFTARAWAVLSLFWVLLLAALLLATAGVIPNRDPGAVQYVTVIAGAVFSVFQTVVNYRRSRSGGKGGEEDR